MLFCQIFYLFFSLTDPILVKFRALFFSGHQRVKNGFPEPSNG
jgi:hypothetical protein